MVQMIKRDFLINRMYFLSIFIIIPLIYFVNLSPLFIYLGIIFGYVFNMFYYEQHNKTNRYMISLPVKRSQIVSARYVLILLTAIIFLLYLWGIDTIAHDLLPKLDWAPTFSFDPIRSSHVLFTFLSVVFMIAVMVPIYYFVDSVIKGLFIQVTLIILGMLVIFTLMDYLEKVTESFILSFLDIIEAYPLLSISLFTVGSLVVSYLCSHSIFNRKDA